MKTTLTHLYHTVSTWIRSLITSGRQTLPLVVFVLGAVFVSSFILWEQYKTTHTYIKENDFSSAAGLLHFVNESNAGRMATSYVVKQGDTFAKVLESFGVPVGHASKYYSSLVPLGLFSIFPGDSMVLKFSPAGTLQSFSLLSKFSEWYHITVADSAFAAKKIPVDVSVYQTFVKGVLNRSLSEDINELGVGNQVVAEFADIFAWDINFFTDPRSGDTFELVYESLYAEGKFLKYGNILAARYVNNGTEYCAIGITGDRGGMQYFDAKGKSLRKQFLKAPLHFSRISSGFSLNRRHPVLGIVRPHLGVDYAAPTGTPVVAAADGIVAFAGRNGGFGNEVVVRHGGIYRSSYGHLHSIKSGIRPGARVQQGDCIGTVGSTGLSTGPHLDYRLYSGTKYLNPQTFSSPSAQGVSSSKIAVLQANKNYFDHLRTQRFVNSEIGSYVVTVTHQQRPGREVTLSSKYVHRTGS